MVILNNTPVVPPGPANQSQASDKVMMLALHWAVVSFPLFDIMKEDDFLAMVSCAMLSYKKSISRFAFVDDTDLCVSSQPTVKSMVIHMQHSVTQWEGLLR